ncbi:MAG: hypothetical protein IPF58_03000 [Saprospirales bacterium]|nr:hypothetical protein [Saprospirales bacterium]
MFQEENTDKIIEQYDAVFNELSETTKNKKSKVPHANYSVSRRLFEMLCHSDFIEQKTISIHNQETPAENELFQTRKGDFIRFYERIGFDTKHIPYTNNTAIHDSLE